MINKAENSREIMLTRQSDKYFVDPKIIATQATSFQKSRCPILD